MATTTAALRREPGHIVLVAEPKREIPHESALRSRRPARVRRPDRSQSLEDTGPHESHEVAGRLFRSRRDSRAASALSPRPVVRWTSPGSNPAYSPKRAGA
jgi:hypothetical protein